ncbi:MAG: hypothetical protein P1Q69_16115 [Candidatus Thorarchaeota archaeon]|nr:hypothetical protein [Candidatus Thorarchaeota archaeon]
MQSPELILPLSIAAVITGITLLVIVRSWWKSRMLPTLLYTLAIACFSGMAIDLLLDQAYLPFRDWYIEINGQILWMSNLLLAFLVVGGFLFWYFAIMYSQMDSLPRSALFLTFIAGGALLGEIVKSSWSEQIPLIAEAIAAAVLIFEIVKYARVVRRVTEDPLERRRVNMYFLGFLLWIIALPIGIIVGGISSELSFVSNLWPVPYTLGLLLVAYTVALNPRLLFISEARPLDFLILDKNGTLVLTHRFNYYEGSIDSELMGSAISGVISLMKEMLASGQELARIDHGDVKVLLEVGIRSTCLLVVSRETARFRQSLRNAMLEFEADYRYELENQGTFVSAFTPFKTRLEEMFL